MEENGNAEVERKHPDRGQKISSPAFVKHCKATISIHEFYALPTIILGNFFSLIFYRIRDIFYGGNRKICVSCIKI